MPADPRVLADEEFCYLTTTGRVTGRSHEIEIWFAIGDAGGPLYLLSGGRDRSDWVKNLRRNRLCTKIRGQVPKVVARS